MSLGNYQVKIVAKNQPGLTNTFYSPSTINVVDYDWVQKDIGKTQGGTERYITFERVNSRGYIENRPTWVVIHGWNGKAEDSKDLAKAIEEYDGYQVGDQVLTLDWDAARTGATSLNAAATWIERVGQFTANTLKSWGISSSSINLVGHSLGAYVSYEIAKQLGGIGKLVALDPASTTAFGYTDEPNVDFSRYSQWAWAFYSSIFGNQEKSRTADESFKIDFLLANDNEKHGAGRNLWANMLRNRNGSVSQSFGLDDMHSNEKPWHIDKAGYGSDWEAEIKAIDIQEGSGSNWVPRQGGLKEI
jgi:pimeloyl-ACP methyl ester carboxylesterase